jgi:putative transposase
MDEVYIKVKGKWMYLYRAIEKNGKTLDLMFSQRRDNAAARLFFRRAIEANGLPSRFVIDKSGANRAGLQLINVGLKFSRTKQWIETLCVKYLNNIVEQDHRFIKKITRLTLGLRPSTQPLPRSLASK